MKNRTIIGIICMLVAIVLTFVVSPFVSKLTTDTVSVPRIAINIQQGSLIEESNIEEVSVQRDSLPKGVITDKDKLIGKYATASLFAGDFFTEEKISTKANTSDDVINGLNGSKVVMSFTIDNFAAGVSGKIQNGDIVSLMVKDGATGKYTVPVALKYVKVVSTTTAGGIDKDKVSKNDDGSFDMPATVTVLVNTTQAQLLADFEESSIICALVYRGNEENARKFLDTQDAYFGSTRTEG